ncbi:MAG: hypothetical protein PHV60_08790, partial [bacterium]|nr:hypothetical protein [bacterium]
MFNKSKLLLGIIFLLIAVPSFAAAGPPVMMRQNLEWSDYGLNFEWARDPKLIKELDMNEHQAKEFNDLSSEIAVAVTMEEEIAAKEAVLKNQIPV